MHIASAWASGILNPPTTRHRLIVAVEGTPGSDIIVGYAAIGPSGDPDCVDNHATGEVLALVVDPDHQRHGHGSRLMAAVVEYLRADGATEANIWVPLGNEPRRAFLLSCGWGPDSAHRDIEAEGRVVREVRLTTVVD